MILILLLLPVLLFGEEDVSFPTPPLLTSIDSEPSGIIDGCVNVITGAFFDYESDLTLQGPEPLSVERVLISNNTHSFQQSRMDPPEWVFNDCYKIGLWKNKDKGQFPCIFFGPMGEMVNFCFHQKNSPRGERTNISSKMLRAGQTNTSQGIIGAQTNIRNNELMLDYDKSVSEIRTSNGTLLKFAKENGFRIDYKFNLGSLHHGHLLREEIKPNYLKTILSYDDKHGVKSRELRSWKNKTLSSLKVTRSHSKVRYEASDGRSVTYQFKDYKVRGIGFSKKDPDGMLTSVTRTDKPAIEYDYTKGHSWKKQHERYYEWPHLCRKTYPNHRFTEITYYTAHECFPKSGEDVSEISPKFCRVKLIDAPLGVDTTPKQKYRFVYNITENGGTTGVYDANKHKTDYTYNKRQRLTGIIKFYDGGAPYTIENLHWGKEDSHKEIELQSRTFGLFNSFHKTFAKVYIYDLAGNIFAESLYGNLTGKATAPLFVDENGIPVEGSGDCFTKYHGYSQDHFHLLLETIIGTRSKTYKYIPETNLLSACYHKDYGRIYLRHFYTYDDQGMVTRHIVDDGSNEAVDDLTGVTERKIEETKRTDSYPYGLPKEVKNLYLDFSTGEERLLRKKVNTFDKCGRLIQEDIYGNDNLFAFTRSWEYDAHGNIQKEIKATGAVIERKYDENDNVIYESGPDPLLQKKFAYDYMNRLIQIEEIHPDGILTKRFRYDLCGNLIAKTDALGNETRMAYDSFNRPIAIENKDTVRYEYDEMSHPTKVIAEDGTATEFLYTVYGKPYQINYPDDTQEFFEYDLEGKIVKETAKNGCQTTYAYDAEGRITKKQQLSLEGIELFSTSKTYNTFHLLTETDPAGNVTSYTYDSAGRKQSETKGDFVTLFEYDALNRCSKTVITSHSNPTEGSGKSFLFDPLNRPVEERIENTRGDILTITKYTYDAAGNRTRIEKGDSLTEITYDTHGTPVVSIDPEGNITRTRLVLNYWNERGQNVMRTEMTDPLGKTTVMIKDSQGHLAEEIILDPFGQELKKTSYLHNGSGKCIQATEAIHYADGSVKELIHTWEYDAAGHLTTHTQAAGTLEEKCSTYSYTPFGQLKTATKPSGIALEYAYDVLGRLATLKSSDQSIHYCYTYDISSNPIQVDDLIEGRRTTRSYDSHHRVIEEILANSMKTAMSYTPEGNLKQITLPDHSSIHYSYNGPQLAEVRREGKSVYTHSYDAYDGNGNLSKSSMISGRGSIDYAYTKNGQLQSIHSPDYSESMEYDPAGNLVKRSFNDPIGSITDSYAYDDLYQLKAEEGHFSHHYSHDSNNNRQSKDGLQHTVNSLNQLIQEGEAKYCYDLSGNLIAKEGAYTCVYDALDRLKTLSTGSITYHYSYDEQNRCIERRENRTKEKILYVGQNDIGTANEKGEIHTLRVLGKGRGAEIGAAVSIEINHTVHVPLHDHRGNVVGLINTENNKKETYRYSAFGEEEIYCQNELQESSLNPWRFSSKRKEGSFYLFGRRFYIPEIGRWLTPDPAGREGGPNLYAFVYNSPLIHMDLYGYFGERADNGSAILSCLWNLGANFYEWMCASIKEGISTTGFYIKTAAHHIIPVPFVKDIVGVTAHFLQTGGTDGYAPSWSSNSTDFYDLGLPDHHEKVAILFINGISNLHIDTCDTAFMISALCSGNNVRFVYNGTLGFAYDVFVESATQKLGIVNITVKKTVEALRYCISKVGGVNSNGLVKVYAHSQGGIILDLALQYLTPREKQRICVATFGSATLIKPDGLKSCVNYVHNWDLVTIIGDPIGYTAARLGLRSDVKFIHSNEWGFKHSLNSYRQALESDWKSFKEENGF